MDKKILKKLYYKQKLSMAEIARNLKISDNKVNYWMKKYDLKRRSHSEATYIKRNPNGDPFGPITPANEKNAFLRGLGLGLYWGEGTKASKHAIRLSNSDPRLLESFLQFLRKIYNIQERRLKFGLHLFTDINPEQALRYWSKKLNIPKSKFYKPQIINLRKKGTYRKKSKYGVLTIMFQSKKLRDKINHDLGIIKDLSSCS